MTGAREPERGLAAANERLLIRLGYDLHDGPLQQVYVLAQDVRLLRDQMIMLVGNDHRDPVVGRFADLESQVAELHQDLRDLAHSLEPRTLLQLALPDAVGRELTALSRRTEITTSIVVDGTFDTLSSSQRIALLRVLQEALSNIKQHSGSRAVSVTLREDEAEGVCMEVRDDGHGFDSDAFVPAKDGQSGIGLAGMRERLRLLDGRLEIESRPGGPTIVRARLPRWIRFGRTARLSRSERGPPGWAARTARMTEGSRPAGPRCFVQCRAGAHRARRLSVRPHRPDLRRSRSSVPAGCWSSSPLGSPATPSSPVPSRNG